MKFRSGEMSSGDAWALMDVMAIPSRIEVM